MRSFAAALWSEALKLRRSKVPLFVALAFSLVPLAGGFFMIILKDPQAARSMGLITAKAQITAGTADWPGFFNILAQGAVVGGGVLFAFLTAWVFGREFSDHTAKELLALPTSRQAIVAAKFAALGLWCLVVTGLMVAFALLVGRLVDLPGWSLELLRANVVGVFGAVALSILLLPWVALAASAGHGYLPAIGWVFLTLALAQIAAVIGWGDWFPWAVPALFSGMAGPRAELLGPHSYLMVVVAGLLGLAATFYWWRYADQTR